MRSRGDWERWEREFRGAERVWITRDARTQTITVSDQYGNIEIRTMRGGK
jgi:hypothetical protein